YDNCDAGNRADDPPASSPEGVRPSAGWAQDQTSRDKDGKIIIHDASEMAPFIGTGLGSDVLLEYTAAAYDGSKRCGGGNFGSKADESLFHELVHCYRKMAGVFNPVPLTGDLNLYHHEEDWLAILYTNIFLAVKYGHNQNLRADHSNHTRLEEPLN